ncbi:cupredoxin domain-containing protein [Mucilaginibacter lappiensis]|uniref:Plastocyanin n=1 Tax=Mucilaginibacter lappiensis TaxID=354630 RepID=A0A1N6NF20_9SPHI|nr:cupredoxin domain-containing protein [Mucilaginibacter lappiensis]MBB6107976.1 plastocyanin [Mucilaginibacter lappiensis]MBB6125953.1 plastocyanin [Mucilaginibacter lappiensis]SIP90695.1 Plastocyanin [Mucilaginibacter lappiensis]
MKIIKITLIAFAGVLLFTACGKSTSSSNTNNPTSKNGDTPVVDGSATIASFAFSPAVLNLKTGGSVTWTNKDVSTHTVTDGSGAFDSGNIQQNQTYTFKFTKAGTYTYHCMIHSMMVPAKVVVTEKNN